MKKIKRLFTTLSTTKVGLLATVACLIIYAAGIQFFNLIDMKAYDFHFRARGPIPTSGEVAIAAIDEISLQQLGKWPWPRTTIAAVIEALDRYEPKVIAFDIVFSEPDQSSGLKTVKSLRKKIANPDANLQRAIEALEKESDTDGILAASIRKSGRSVLGYFLYTNEADLKGLVNRNELPRLLGDSRFNSTREVITNALRPDLLRARGVAENIPIITKASKNFGYFNILPDADGTIRWAQLAMDYKGEHYPHISVEALRKYTDDPPLVLNMGDYGVDSIDIGHATVPTNESGHIVINYRGPQKTFPHYSVSDIIAGKVPPDALKDKIVLLGATAIGIYDMRVTPVDGVFPGVEVLANIIDTMLVGDYIVRPQWVSVFDVISIMLPGIILSLIVPKIRAIFTTLLTLALTAAYILANNYMLNRHGIWLTMVYPVFTIAFVSISATTYQFITEERKRKEIKDAFSHYVSPSLVGEILKNPDKLVLGGEERRITVLFSDIRGFTTITEGLKPQALVKLMNDYLTPMTDVVLKHGGTVDKYMGDAIMAFWNAPLDQEDHAVRASNTCLDMMKKLKELQKVWDDAGVPKIDIGIGLSSGRVIVGNMGSNTRFDYTAMGDTVNLGSRLEGLNKEYGTHVIVPKYTYEEVREHFILRELDSVRVKGKEIPIHIYELMGRNDAENAEKLRETAKYFEDGLRAYRAMNWDMAEEYFKKTLEVNPGDKTSEIFLKRVEHLRTDKLSDNWDGVFVMTKK